MAQFEQKCTACGSNNLKFVRVTPTDSGPINSYICQSCGININLHVESGVAVNVRRRKTHSSGSATPRMGSSISPARASFAPKRSISTGSYVRTIVTIIMIILLVYVFIL